MSAFPLRARAAGLDEQIVFNIPAQPLESALLRFSQQASLQLLTSSDELPSAQSNEVSGRLAVRVALATLLQGTGLTFSLVRDGTIAIRSEQAPSAGAAASAQASSLRLAQADTTVRFDEPNADAKKRELEEVTVTIPEVLVVGSKILNMDIRRTEDDPQPYVIFDRKMIERSGAGNLQDFLKQRLPMNTADYGGEQGGSLPGAVFGAVSQINLRGLGTSQTLILVDGRRLPGVSAGGNPNQPDLNGIPIAAVERIEVLPTTASGIYGGSATGGVVNVILRRDYVGAQVKATYENTFESDASSGRADFSAGLPLEQGKTNIIVSASWADTGDLLTRDRSLFERGRARIFSNNAGFILDSNIPPLGATTNIRSANNTPLFGPGSSSFASVPTGYTGGGGIAGLQAGAGAYNLALGNNAMTNGGGNSGLLRASELRAGSLAVRRQFTANLEAFADAAYSRNTSRFSTSGFSLAGVTVAATAPNNPFGQAIRVTVPSAAGDGFEETQQTPLRLAGGIIAKLPAGWSAAADYTWSRASLRSWTFGSALLSALQTDIGNGTVDVLRDTTASPLDLGRYLSFRKISPFRSTTRDASLRIGGTVGTLPAGRPSVTALLEHRQDEIGDGTGTEFRDSGPGTPFVATGILQKRTQTVKSAYVELKLPLASGIPALRELELQLAARFDDYRTKSGTARVVPGSTAPIVATRSRLSSIDPTIGLRWKPIDDLVFRASYGTGFLPPSVGDLGPPTPGPGSGGGAGANLIDPRRGNTLVGNSYHAQFGSNPDLQPEESESWSAGAIFAPRIAEGLRVSVDYTHINKRDNFRTLSGQLLIDNESLFPDRVIRAAAAPGDPFGVGPITFLDLTILNASRAQIEAYDAQIDYSLDTQSVGTFAFFIVATRQTHFKTKLVSNAAWAENAGITSAFPLKLKGSFGATWTYGQWDIGWSGRYMDSYYVANPSAVASAVTFQNQGSPRVASQNYHDVFVNYTFRDQPGTRGWAAALARTEISAGVKNVFNAKPPFDAASSPLGVSAFYSPFGDPRLTGYYLSIKSAF